MSAPDTRFHVKAELPKPERFINVTVSIEETDAQGHCLSAVYDPKRATTAISVFLTKRLEIILDDGVMFARQHQISANVGEEREDGRYLGLSAAREVKEAVWDYVKHRLGIGL
jgi:hypothetical protein